MGLWAGGLGNWARGERRGEVVERGGLESWPVVFEDPGVSKASPDDTATLTGSECDLISLTLYYHISSRGRNLLLDRGGITAGI